METKLERCRNALERREIQAVQKTIIYLWMNESKDSDNVQLYSIELP